MTRFSLGEDVIIRYGKQQGQRATVVANEPPDVYTVKLQDGWVLTFSGKGLERERENSGSNPLAGNAWHRCLGSVPLKGHAMVQTKTLQQRQKELQALLAEPAGQKELQDLEAQYSSASGKLKPPRESIITYILVHERAKGLING